MFLRQVAAVAAFVGVVAAQLSIIDPSPISWWVSGSTNTLAWTCDSSPYSTYTVVVTNSNSTILSSPLSLIANIPNYDCSYTVNQQQSSLAVSDTWTIELTDPENSTHVYASTPFSVKPAGSPYPPTA